MNSILRTINYCHLVSALVFAVMALSVPCHADSVEQLVKPLSAQESQVLKKGNVFVSEEPAQDKGQRRVVAKVLIERPLEQVWKALSNQESLFQGESHLKKVKVLGKPTKNQELVEYTMSVSRLLPTFVYVTSVDYKHQESSIRFKRLSGSFKQFEGFCALAPTENGQKTVMTYALEVDPGFLIPPFVVRQILKGELPSILSHVKNRVHHRYPVIEAH